MERYFIAFVITDANRPFQWHMNKVVECGPIKTNAHVREIEEAFLRDLKTRERPPILLVGEVTILSFQKLEV